MTFEEFRASMKLMTPADYDDEIGADLTEMAQPGDMVRCYEHGAWILYRADGTHWMHIETEEYSTEAGGYSLADLERTLWKWTGGEDEPAKPAEPTPGEDADHETLVEWAASHSRTHTARLAAALLIQLLDPENNDPDPTAAAVIAGEIGADFTMSLAMLAAEVHRRA